jgi:hypothetical protein
MKAFGKGVYFYLILESGATGPCGQIAHFNEFIGLI